MKRHAPLRRSVWQRAADAVRREILIGALIGFLALCAAAFLALAFWSDVRGGQ